MVRPTQLGAVEYAGIVVGVAGGALALWCILTFAVVGRGTPAPFDPPRKLVIRGPYRYVRNPMYLGAALALCSAALFYRSTPLFGYAVCFFSPRTFSSCGMRSRRSRACSVLTTRRTGRGWGGG
jgi:protein-S-isoprenylcysteine O-methyltransferase Ste14